jgi:hypothetical protein
MVSVLIFLNFLLFPFPPMHSPPSQTNAATYRQLSTQPLHLPSTSIQNSTSVHSSSTIMFFPPGSQGTTISTSRSGQPPLAWCGVRIPRGPLPTCLARLLWRQATCPLRSGSSLQLARRPSARVVAR